MDLYVCLITPSNMENSEGREKIRIRVSGMENLPIKATSWKNWARPEHGF
jgi:hypothetical protein